MRTPRSDIVTDAFCAGKTIAELALAYWASPAVIESAIRRQLNRERSRKR